MPVAAQSATPMAAPPAHCNGAKHLFDDPTTRKVPSIAVLSSQSCEPMPGADQFLQGARP